MDFDRHRSIVVRPIDRSLFVIIQPVIVALQNHPPVHSVVIGQLSINDINQIKLQGVEKISIPLPVYSSVLMSFHRIAYRRLHRLFVTEVNVTPVQAVRVFVENRLILSDVANFEFRSHCVCRQRIQ